MLNRMVKHAFRRRTARFARRFVRHDGGFTLIEVIAAIAILALSAGVIFQVTSNSVRNLHRAKALTGASMLAQSLLARVGTDIPLQEGESRGQAAPDLQWHLQIERYGDAEDRKQWPVAAYSVLAEVVWDNGPDARRIELRTLRLGPHGASTWR